jgi:hypothetical protein
MRLSPQERKEIGAMFGGRCAWCGEELGERWHVDHVEAVRRETLYLNSRYKDGRYLPPSVVRTNRLGRPENDRRDNLFPACVRCNVLKGAAGIEEFRAMFAYFAASIPTIRTYSHVHHLMRFGKLTIDTTPVVFWFERCREREAQ